MPDATDTITCASARGDRLESASGAARPWRGRFGEGEQSVSAAGRCVRSDSGGGAGGVANDVDRASALHK
jgi:hypothetical protein